VLGPARPLAERGLDAVLARAEGLLLGGLGLEVKLDAVRADLEALGELRGAERERRRGRVDRDGNLAGAGRVLDGELHGNGKGGADGARRRVGRELGDRGGAEAHRAGVELLADVDGIGVRVLDKLHELGDADVVAQQVADGGLDLVAELPAERAARAKDAALEDDLEKRVDRLAHELDAERAEGELGLDTGCRRRKRKKKNKKKIKK
jgi:hypothetical protein